MRYETTADINNGAGAASSPVKAKPGKSTPKKSKVPWILLAPTLFILTAVGFYPLVYSLYISFTGYRPTQPHKEQGFVGLDNYISVLTNADFLHAIKLTTVFTASSVTISLILGIGLALLFNQEKPGFKAIRTLILIPMLVTPIAVGLLWRSMMMPDFGILNYLLSMIGLEGWTWVGSTSTSLMSVILVDVWQWTPFMFLIIFAGLKSLPTSPFEAARIDGAGPVRIFFSLTLPMLKPIMSIALILRIIDAIRTYDTIHIITRGGPNFSTELVSDYLSRVNFKFFNIGYGSASSWVVLVFIILVILIFVNLSGFMKNVAEKEN